VSTNYNRDEVLLEIQNEMYSREEKASTLKKLDPKTRLVIGIVLAGIIIMAFLNKISFTTGIFLGVGLGVIVLMLISGTETRKELTWVECMIRIRDLLKLLQNHPIGDVPQIPLGEVHIKPVGRKQWYGGQAHKRSYGVSVWNQETDTTQHYFIEVDVFTGDIITFKKSDEGVWGDEPKDIEFLPSFSDMMARKRDIYMGKKQSD